MFGNILLYNVVLIEFRSLLCLYFKLSQAREEEEEKISDKNEIKINIYQSEIKEKRK